MSSLILEQTEIKNILPHPNPEVHSLEMVQVYGWMVIAKKNQYKKGQPCIYLPPDSVLSEELELKLFPPESKIKLYKRRLKSIRIKGALSQGMIVSTDEFSLEYIKNNLTKYEPPEESIPIKLKGNQPKKELLNNDFRKYVDIENYKYYDRVLQEDEEVVITLKMHGTSSRFSNIKPTNLTIWKRIKQLLGFMGEYEFCYGSRNVQLSDGTDFSYKNEKQGVNMDNVYKFVAKKYKMNKIIPNGYGLYGEIVGKNVQKNYHYNVKDNDYEFYLYDIYNFEEQRWLNYNEYLSMFSYCQETAYLNNYETIKRCPELYKGLYSINTIEQYRNGKDPIQTDIEREGIVVKPTIERYSPSLGRTILKCISDEYWLGKQSDFH